MVLLRPKRATNAITTAAETSEVAKPTSATLNRCALMIQKMNPAPA